MLSACAALDLCLSLSRPFPPSLPHTLLLPIPCSSTSALAGNYVNFGVFKLYGDPALKNTLCVALHLCTFLFFSSSSPSSPPSLSAPPLQPWPATMSILECSSSTATRLSTTPSTWPSTSPSPSRSQTSSHSERCACSIVHDKKQRLKVAQLDERCVQHVVDCCSGAMRRRKAGP